MPGKIHHLALAIVALMLCAVAPIMAQRAPDWMEGRFEGAGRIEGQIITLDAGRDGILTATSHGDRRSSDRLAVSIRRSILTIEGRDYDVERTSEGFRAVPRDDSNDRGRDRLRPILFRRVENDRSSDRRPPKWMIGRFEASGRIQGISAVQRAIYAITDRGDVNVAETRRGDVGLRSAASYRRDELVIDGRPYRVEETREGFRAIPVSTRLDRPVERGLEINFRRIGQIDDRGIGRNDSITRLPDWFGGTYTGFSRRDNQTLIVRLESKGDLTLVVRGTDLRNRNSASSYRRGTLTMDGRDYTIERTSDGFLAIPTDNKINRDHSGEISFRRTGN